MPNIYWKRRQMLTYIGLSVVTASSTIACQSQRSRSTQNRSLAEVPSSSAQSQAKPNLPEFEGIEQWLNSDPLSVKDLKGHVTLVQIWTFACINCQRTLPSIRRWHEQYANQGLKVISIHTPEFSYERDIGNVKRAVQQNGITYPVAIDNQFRMWKAYQNEYWPHLFLADRDGVIQYDHIGEGAYDTTEKTIQRLLT